MTERTFSIIKPDAVKAGNAGAILSRLEKAGFRIVALRLRHADEGRGRGLLPRPPGAPLLREPVRVHVLGALHHDGARARRRHRASCARSWARRTRPRPRRARSARTSPRRSRPTRSTARTRRRRRRSRSATSSGDRAGLEPVACRSCSAGEPGRGRRGGGGRLAVGQLLAPALDRFGHLLEGASLLAERVAHADRRPACPRCATTRRRCSRSLSRAESVLAPTPCARSSSSLKRRLPPLSSPRISPLQGRASTSIAA